MRKLKGLIKKDYNIFDHMQLIFCKPDNITH